MPHCRSWEPAVGITQMQVERLDRALLHRQAKIAVLSVGAATDRDQTIRSEQLANFLLDLTPINYRQVTVIPCSDPTNLAQLAVAFKSALAYLN